MGMRDEIENQRSEICVLCIVIVRKDADQVCYTFWTDFTTEKVVEVRNAPPPPHFRLFSQ
jgi:hypothetical protein